MTVTFRLTGPDFEEEIYLRFTGDVAFAPSASATEAAVALCLIPAMKMGAPLSVDGPISPAGADAIGRFQEIFSCWYPEYGVVPVKGRGDGPGEARAHSQAAGAGVFFSGGVDSFYTLLKHEKELTHAIFVHGCDIPLERVDFRRMVSERLRETCRVFGKKLIEVETNLLGFTDRYAHWGYHYHGAGLAAIALLLDREIASVRIAASRTWTNMRPWGSHMTTDSLWSSPFLAVIHDGQECGRTGKVLAITKNPLVLEQLRVCWENVEGQFNCGRCEKCLRTMISLRLCGVRDTSAAFAEPLDLEVAVPNVDFPLGEASQRTWRALVDWAEAAGTDEPLIRTLRELYRKHGYTLQVKELARNNREVLQSPAWAALLPKLRNKLWDSLADHDPDWFRRKLAVHATAERDAVFSELWKKDRRWCRRETLRRTLRHWREKIGRWFGGARGDQA